MMQSGGTISKEQMILDATIERINDAYLLISELLYSRIADVILYKTCRTSTEGKKESNVKNAAIRKSKD